MNIRKKLVILAIIGATSLVAADLKDVGLLVDQIKNTSDVKVKEKLMMQLNHDIETLNKEDVLKAQAIIDKKLNAHK